MDESGIRGNTIPKLKGAENYKVWRIQIDIVIKAKKLQRYIDGRRTKPVKIVDETQTAFEDREDEFESQDSAARGLLINNCITTIILDIQHLKLSKEVWDYLAGKYQPKGIAHQFGQYQEWNSLKYDGKDLEGFCSKYHAGLLSLKECDLKVDERIQIYQFIIHISPFFESFASNLRQSMRDMAAKEDLPSLDTIINNTLEESLAQKEAAAANFARNGRNHSQNNLGQGQGQRSQWQVVL